MPEIAQADLAFLMAACVLFGALGGAITTYWFFERFMSQHIGGDMRKVLAAFAAVVFLVLGSMAAARADESSDAMAMAEECHALAVYAVYLQYLAQHDEYRPEELAASVYRANESEGKEFAALMTRLFEFSYNHRANDPGKLQKHVYQSCVKGGGDFVAVIPALGVR